MATNIATFDGTGSQSTVTVDAPQTVGSIVFSGAVSYTIGGSNALTLDNGGTASISSSSSGTQTISAPITVASNLNLTSTVGTLDIQGDITNSGTVTVAGPGTVALGNVSGGSVVLSTGTLKMNGTNSGSMTLDGGTLGGGGNAGAVAAGSGAHTIYPSLGSGTPTTLTMASLTTNSNTTLKLRLGNAGASDVVHATGSLDISGGVTMDLSDHIAGASLGYFSVVQYGTLTGTVGNISLPADVNGVHYFATTTRTANFIDLHRGYMGDANDNGFVDLTDLAILAANWQTSGTWENGDFNQSGFVDLTDLAILAGRWQTGIDPFGAAADSLSGTSESFQAAVASIVFGATVPEPTSLSLLGLGAVGLLARRRRRA